MVHDQTFFPSDDGDLFLGRLDAWIPRVDGRRSGAVTIAPGVRVTNALASRLRRDLGRERVIVTLGESRPEGWRWSGAVTVPAVRIRPASGDVWWLVVRDNPTAVGDE